MEGRAAVFFGPLRRLSRARVRLSSVCLIAAALGAFPVLAGPLEHSCLAGDRPAASLLFPYFEVDLAAADGTTTLISIGNAGAQPTVAHVVMWTDWGLPTVAFDIGLDADQVRTFNLRALLAGEIPLSAVIDGFPSCALPVPPIPIDVEELRARHTGRPASSGLCYGSGRLGPTVAIGYLTVDTLRDCGHDAIPGDLGYFDDGAGLATNDNVLFGEFFLLEPGENFAQGIDAAPLVADGELFAAGAFDTFYRPRGVGDADDRAPLSSQHRARFLDGGGFGGTTDLLVWHAGIGADAEPKTCGGGPFDDNLNLPYLSFTLQNEAGETLDDVGFTPPALAFRVPIGGPEIPLAPDQFGTVEVDATAFACPLLIPCVAEPLQSWVASLIRADGRYSVGVEATRLDDPCR